MSVEKLKPDCLPGPQIQNLGTLYLKHPPLMYYKLTYNAPIVLYNHCYELGNSKIPLVVCVLWNSSAAVCSVLRHLSTSTDCMSERSMAGQLESKDYKI